MVRTVDKNWLLFSVNAKLFQSVPDAQDIHWTNRVYNIPKITFGTIYDYLVDRKVILNKISCLERMADKRTKAVDGHTEVLETNGDGVPIQYTRTLDKAYRFFQDGHMQNIKYHPLPSVPDHICITTTVLPSMRKDRIYSVTVFIHESARVAKACCSCLAGLSGWKFATENPPPVVLLSCRRYIRSHLIQSLFVTEEPTRVMPSLPILITTIVVE